MKNNKYAITLANENGDTINQIEYKTYNKQDIANAMLKLLLELRTSPVGYELEYWKQNDKYAYMPMLTLEKTQHGVKQQIIKGDKVYYKNFDIDNFIKLNLVDPNK